MMKKNIAENREGNRAEKRVSILGCGWLGLPLAIQLIKKGYQVSGLCQTIAQGDCLKKNGVHPYITDIYTSNLGCNQPFFEPQVMIILLPFKRTLSSPFKYLDVISTCLRKLGPVCKTVIFSSSTSIYPSENKHCVEAEEITPSSDRAKVLKEVERLILESKVPNRYNFRIGGMIGEGRNSRRQLESGHVFEDGAHRVNLIHRDDIIEILLETLKESPESGAYNLVCDEHPTKAVYYGDVASRYGLQSPKFKNNGKTPYKVVSNQKIKDVLSYAFKYPDPQMMI